MILQIEDVHAHYGHVHALRGVSLSVREGETVTLIGANGAGKSTLMTSILGAPRISRGRILFQGASLQGLGVHEISRRGIAISPEGRRVFPRMTVTENLLMGATFADPATRGTDMQRMFEMFPILSERSQQLAGTLSGGEQQMLAIARALMSHPRLLLMDEPSLGLAPIYIRKVFEIIDMLNRDHGMTILLVEQNANQALRVAHRAYVLQQGSIVMSGTGRELLQSPEVRAAYLEGGKSHNDPAVAAVA
ncbi:leucine/isoleucine/valine transporter subunit; ATP-binding component of ABC superfamily [Cupriavidus necator]|uniref:Leucine/isoleucine/valine transporter subunit ATP-binding component of ABC superfamily n=1 Tax=Cupriavidus necator TaxID=106590 RepID=A0A1K0JBM0_CUPNE|nr:leucine/isoleucine/valine transporter subunit; ATP-binding component of ABC superfamily [Cupriavidus necator]